MPLPDSSSGIRWNNYRIATPTFRLTPVEKPDSSPFLIHMTGKNSLASIIKGDNSGDGIEIPNNHGYIKASIPAFDISYNYYNAPVVCFTESPIFALDFFRYRSFRRWESDQQFGIGFSKEALIHQKDVRPVLYLDSQTNSEVLSVCNQAEANTITFSADELEDLRIKAVFRKIKPLLFPMLETRPYQGFMWEREWRYTNPAGMIFPYNAIKLICCPDAEKEELLEALGNHAGDIQIVESWREYDEVTDYLKQRSQTIDSNAINQIDQINDLITLQDLRQKNEQTVNTLIAYYEVFKETVDQLEGKNINQTIEGLQETSAKLTSRIEKLNKDIKAAEEQKKQEAKTKLGQ